MRKPNGLRLNLDLFYDYWTNVELYPRWQKFLRNHQPRTLIFWGENDPFFTPEGGEILSEGPPSGRNAPTERRSLRDRRQSALYRRAYRHFLRQERQAEEVIGQSRQRGSSKRTTTATVPTIPRRPIPILQSNSARLEVSQEPPAASSFRRPWLPHRKSGWRQTPRQPGPGQDRTRLHS